MIQDKLNFDEPYGEIIGDSEARYTQNGIDFNVRGIRISPYTDEEKAAAEAKKEADAAMKVVDEKKAAAVKSLEEKRKPADTDPTKGDKQYPEGWDTMTRTDLTNYAWNKFRVEMPKSYSLSRMKKKVESLL